MTARAHVHAPPGCGWLVPALRDAGLGSGEPEDGLIFAQRSEGLTSFDDVEAEMTESFRLTRRAASAGAPALYVVCIADLLGQRGSLAAMLANGLLSAARSMALEGRRDGRIANALGHDPDPRPEEVASWALLLLEGRGVTGGFVAVGAGHLAKVVP